MKDKIPFYNIVNMFFVGAVSLLFLVVLLWNDISMDWIKRNAELLSDWSVLVSIILLIAAYEIGFIINRLGSIVIEPILIRMKIWPRQKYKIDISEISEHNRKFQSMILELNLMRSHIMMCLLLLIISLIVAKWWFCLVFVALSVIFIFGGQKHNAKINIIREEYLEQKQKREKLNEEQQKKVI